MHNFRNILIIFIILFLTVACEGTDFFDSNGSTSKNSVTVTFDVHGGTLSSPDKLVVKVGKLVAEPTPPTRAGYLFIEWQLSGVKYDFNTPVTRDITLVAIWEVIPPMTYTVTFNVDGGTPQPASLPVNHGDKIPAPAEPTKAGFDFKGWEHNGVAWDFATDVVTGDMTLTAKWEVITSVTTYTVTFALNGGQTTSPTTVPVNHGDKISAPVAPTKAGFDFKGWEHSGVAWNFATDVVTGDMTLTAKWEVITYTVTFALNGGQTTSPTTVPVNHGDKISAPTEPTKAGFDFKGWEHNGVAWNFATDVVTGDMTLTAKWEVITYTVTFNIDGGTPQPASLPVNYGDKISAPTDPTKAEHNFKGWEHNGVAWNFATDVVTGDMTLTAKWEVITYTVTFALNGGQTTSPTTVPVNHGDNISAPAEPTKAGFDFKGWERSGVAWDFATDVVTGDMTLTAKWEVMTVTLTNPQTFSITKMDGAADRTKNYALEISSPSAVIETATTTFDNITVAHSGHNVQLTASIYSGVVPSPSPLPLPMNMELTVKIVGLSVLYAVDIPIHVETGEGASPYIISDEADLRAINSSINLNGKYYELGADIELDVATYGNWAPIGSSTAPFAGSMDGKYHKISNLTIDNASADDQGLFGYVESGGTHEISNIHLEDVDIKAGFAVGGLAGRAIDATIDNVTISGAIKGSGVMVGGLVGQADNSTINASSSQGSVEGSNRVGGIVGWQDGGEISSSFSSSAVSTAGGTVGGLVGDMTLASLRDSYALGDVTSGTDFSNTNINNIAGGVVGRAVSSTIKDSFAEGKVVSSHTAGGLVGILIQSTRYSYIEGSYSSGDVYGGAIAGGLVGKVNNSYTEDCYALGDVFAMNKNEAAAAAGGLFGNIYITQNSTAPKKSALLFAYGDVYSAFMYAGGLFGYVDVNLMPDYAAALNRSVSAEIGGDDNVGRIVGFNMRMTGFDNTYKVYSSKFTKFTGANITTDVGIIMGEVGGNTINGFTEPKVMSAYDQSFYEGMYNGYYASISEPSPRMWVFADDGAGNMRIMHAWQMVGKLSYHATDGRKQLINGRRLKVTDPTVVTGADIHYYVKSGYSIKAEVSSVETDLLILNNIAIYTPVFDSVSKSAKYTVNVYDSAGKLAISFNETYTIVEEGVVPVFPIQ